MTVLRGREKLKFSFRLSRETGTLVYNADGYVRTTEMNGLTQTITGGYREGYVLPEAQVGKTVQIDSYMIGFSPESKEIGFVSVTQNAYCNTKFVVKLVYKAIWDMISGKAGIEQVSGPVGVVGAVNDAVHSSAGFWAVAATAALLTINLGIFNLLPIPALDGGRIFFMLVELVRGKPISPEKEGLVHAIGLLLLLIFAALISVKDIMQLIH
jgi:regulator of sigma E protease